MEYNTLDAFTLVASMLIKEYFDKIMFTLVETDNQISQLNTHRFDNDRAEIDELYRQEIIRRDEQLFQLMDTSDEYTLYIIKIVPKILNQAIDIQKQNNKINASIANYRKKFHNTSLSSKERLGIK